MDVIDPDKNKKIIKRFFLLAIVFLLALLIARSIEQDVKPSQKYVRKDLSAIKRKLHKLPMPVARLNECTNEKLGLAFLCDYRWEEIDVSDDATLYKISINPAVEFKIIKFNISIVSIQQLNRVQLEAIGQYADGFAVEDSQIADYKAIKIKAFSITDPNTRLLDYYFVRDKKTLYALMFSVTPKTQWDNYKYVFQKIVEEFTFIQK